MSIILLFAIAFACLIAGLAVYFIKQRWWIKLLLFIAITASLLWLMFIVLLLFWPGGHN